MIGSDAHESGALDIQATGVFGGHRFPLQCRRIAEENQLSGWVREGADSCTVAIHLEGLGYRLDGFLDWIRGGVEGVRISRIDVSRSSKEGWEDFEILA